MANGEHVVADLYRRIGDENTREVGEWLHEVAEQHALQVGDDVIPPTVPWLAMAVSHYLSNEAFRNPDAGQK